MKQTRLAMLAAAAALFIVTTPSALARDVKVDARQSAQALDILKRSVAFKTVAGQGQVPAYAAYLADVLKAAGFAADDIRIVRHGETATLIARYRGTDASKKPILLAGHMDVVEAMAADWARDPFTPVAENGYLYGRGVEDNKFDVSMMVATLARLKQEGFKPGRDIILALSGDEETDMVTTRALAAELKGAELLLNGDAGGGMLGADGKPMFYGLQAGEKTYADFEISFTNPGGHSSRPTRTNAIYQLAQATSRIGAHQFPVQANELTRASLRAASAQTPGEIGQAMKRFADNPADAEAAAMLSADPEWIGQVRTTCVATMTKAGHALNALPQNAALSVNCRIFPGVSIDSVKQTLTGVIADPEARITVLGNPAFSDASPLRADVMAAMRKAINARHPGLPIVPNMSAGATDSLHFRAQGVPSYGVAGLFMKPTDSYAHGLNERIPLAAIDGALVQWHILLRELAR